MYVQLAFLESIIWIDQQNFSKRQRKGRDGVIEKKKPEYGWILIDIIVIPYVVFCIK